MAPWGAVLEVAVSVTTLESPSLSDLLLWLRALQPPCGEREFDVEAATILSSLHWGLPAHVNCSLRTQERLMNAMWGWWREWWKASDQFWSCFAAMLLSLRRCVRSVLCGPAPYTSSVSVGPAIVLWFRRGTGWLSILSGQSPTVAKVPVTAAEVR